MENQVRELLRSIAEDIPPQREVPPTLRRRARRRVAATVVVTVVVVGALAMGGVAALREISESSPRPANPGPTVEPSPLGAGEVLTVMKKDLVAQDPDRGEARTIVDNVSLPPAPGEDITGAAWSPDRQWVAFRRGPGSGDGSLWVVESTGDAPRRLAAVGGYSRWAWSPIGDELVLAAGRNVMLIDAATGVETGLGTAVGGKDSEGEVVHTLAWSPDGSQIAYEGDGGVYSIDVQSGEHSLLVGQPTGLGRPNVIAYSPDGTHLAILYYSRTWRAQALYVANADGSDLRLVVDGPEVGMAWSPDGSRLAYTNLSGPDYRIGFRVWTVRVGGGTPSLVTSGCCITGGVGVLWSPDGSEIAFETEHEGGTPNVYLEHLVVSADGTDESRAISGLTYDSWQGGQYFCGCYG